MAIDNNKNNVKYKVFYPGGNTTAIVFSNHKDSVSEVSREIMASNPEIEQVGFVLSGAGPLRLQMMGGEFCVNAASSAASHWLNEKNIDEVKFTVSGFDQEITAQKSDQLISLSMPGSLVVGCTVVFDGFLVELQGISYLVTTKKDLDADSLVRAYYNSSPAFGIIFLEKNSYASLKIEPTVWVKETGTFVKESACGSGSIAACIPFRDPSKNEIFFVKQPSGHRYEIRFKPSLEIELLGEVRFLGEKELKITE